MRQSRALWLALASVLSIGPSLTAQVSDGAGTPSPTRLWLGGAAGIAGDSAGVVLQWEGAIAYRHFVAGYEESRSDDFSGTKRHVQVVFGGVRVPWRRLSLLAAAGAANAMSCSGASDQSSACTRSRDFHVPIIKLSADLSLLPIAALYVSTLQPLRRGVAFPDYVVGFRIGKLW